MASRSGQADLTENEKKYINNYSEYTIKISCSVKLIASHQGQAGSGCCIRDKSQKGGGYCMTLNSTANGVDSFFLTDANFETVLSLNDMASISQPAD